MAFAKEVRLRSVEVLPESNAVNVCWINRVYEDEILISESFVRSVYTNENMPEFLEDVLGAEHYAQALGWICPMPDS